MLEWLCLNIFTQEKRLLVRDVFLGVVLPWSCDDMCAGIIVYSFYWNCDM